MMNYTTPIKPAAAGYTPYFYQSGLFLRYDQYRGRASQQPSLGERAAYEFSSFTPAVASLREPQTVEQIIARGYFAAAQGEPSEAIITDRAETSWMGLDDLIHQIRSRYQIYHQNMYELDLSVCEANNAVFRQEADQGHPADVRQRYSANKMIQKIYEQQRAERVELWRDVARLRVELPEAAQQYLGSYRKLAILSSMPGESE